MQSPEKLWEENPLRSLAERSLEKPGMYLIALRAHLHRGKAAVGELLEDVAQAFPHPAKGQSSSESEA
jgi:hypothetical protein